jgi:hypothetical protein
MYCRLYRIYGIRWFARQPRAFVACVFSGQTPMIASIIHVSSSGVNNETSFKSPLF